MKANAISRKKRKKNQEQKELAEEGLDTKHDSVCMCLLHSLQYDRIRGALLPNAGSCRL